jgi:hypothetical protein
MPLYFPGSEEKQESDPNELTFRDGKRTVAPYLAILLGALDTERYTYDEAIAAMNQGLLNDHAQRSVDRLLSNRRT